MRKRIKKLAVVLLSLLAVLCIVPMRGYSLGFDWSITFDPTQALNVGKQIVQEVQQLAILRNNLQLLVTEVSQIKQNAIFFSHKSAWTGLLTSVKNSWTLNRYGETGGWNSAVTGPAGNPAMIWANATTRWTTPTYYATLGVGHPRIADLATVEISDGAAVASMQTLADSRTNAAANLSAYTSWRVSALSGAAGDNSETQQLNLITGGTGLLNQQMQNQNAVETAILENQMILVKAQRDSKAEGMQFAADVESLSAPAGSLSLGTNVSSTTQGGLAQ